MAGTDSINIKMMRTVEYFFPLMPQNKKFFLYSKSRVPLINKATTIYETVQAYEKSVFHRIKPQIRSVSKRRVSISSLINIHDEDGIKNIDQIKNFISTIKSGNHIVESSGLPNIKLARLRGNNFLVFDGHHSLLAYMASGKTFIDEIPHLMVSGNRGYLKNTEILVFWGHHARDIPVKKWKNFVINWQNPEKQITIRTRRNMGELFDAVKVKI